MFLTIVTFEFVTVVKMASRAGTSRRVPENDSTIAYVQADGLVSTSNNSIVSQVQISVVINCLGGGVTL